jgi:hypothetical protein
MPFLIKSLDLVADRLGIRDFLAGVIDPRRFQSHRGLLYTSRLLDAVSGLWTAEEIKKIQRFCLHYAGFGQERHLQLSRKECDHFSSSPTVLVAYYLLV